MPTGFEELEAIADYWRRFDSGRRSGQGSLICADYRLVTLEWKYPQRAGMIAPLVLVHPKLIAILTAI
jgi:hypothetical protein